MAVFRTQISCIAMWLVQVSAHTSPWEWIARVWCFPDSILCLYSPQCQLYWRDIYCTHQDFLRSIAASISECCQYWKWEGKIYRGEDGWRGKWCRSLDIAKESWDQGCLHSAFGGAPCIAPRNPSFPGTAGNLLTVIHLYSSQADVTAAARSEDPGHILISVPTGWGKTLPMILTALLMPPGDTIPCYYWWINNRFISSQAQQLLYWCHWPPLRSSWRLNVTSWA